MRYKYSKNQAHVFDWPWPGTPWAAPWKLYALPPAAKFVALWKGRGRKEAIAISKLDDDEWIMIGEFNTKREAESAMAANISYASYTAGKLMRSKKKSGRGSGFYCDSFEIQQR